jgi:hypothetical protein
MNANPKTIAVSNETPAADLMQETLPAAPVALPMDMLGLVGGGDDVICW